MTLNRVVIVGASLAGLSAARTLRRADEAVELVMIGDEPHYPYDRPPLSKGFLAGSTPEEKLRLRAAADPDELGVEWKLGVRATALDVEAREVTTDDGATIAYDGLVIATGARPRALPGSELAGVHVLRSLDDARSLKAGLDAGPDRVVVIGAGFIGAEVAATAREAGLEVTIIEAAPAPLARVLDESAGVAIADLHRSHGVDVRLGVGVASIDGAESVESVTLADGERIDCDVVVVGIGVVPNTDWLDGSGLTIDDGIVCDSGCLAAPGVVAAGDVARWDHPDHGLVRVEQWDNGVEQGAFAARRLLADAAGEPPEVYGPVPWFWSDQYDRKIQLAGVPAAATVIVHGTIEEQRFVQLYLDDDGRPVGALAWNRPRHAIQARQLLADRASLDDMTSTLA